MTRRVARGMRLRFVLLALAIAGPATAGERLSVFMIADGDRALAENLVEVTIAELSGAREWELVGMRELESSLKQLPKVDRSGLAACLDTPACLSEVGARAGTPRAVIGKVRRTETSFEVELALVDTRTSSAEKSTGPATAADVKELIVAVQRGAAKLVELDAPSPADPPPLGPAMATPVTLPGPNATSGAAPIAPVGSPRPSTALKLADDGQTRGAEKMSLPTYVGFGAAGLAVVAFSAAVIAGSVAKAPPSGETRKEQQEDLERRKDYAVAANVAFAAGGVLSAVAVVAFVWE